MPANIAVTLEVSLDKKAVLFQAKRRQLKSVHFSTLIYTSWMFCQSCSTLLFEKHLIDDLCVVFAFGRLHSAAVLSDWISTSIRQLLDAESHADWLRCCGNHVQVVCMRTISTHLSDRKWILLSLFHFMTSCVSLAASESRWGYHWIVEKNAIHSCE